MRDRLQSIAHETREAVARETMDLQFRFAVEDSGTFSGHAVVFGEQNRHRELYAPGVFKRTLEEHRANGTTPVMLWSHNPAEVIGVWTDIREDATGLSVRGQLLMDTVRGREVASMLKAKAVSGLSIGFRKVKDRIGRDGIRTLLDVDLPEISIVAVPSAGRARITDYRNHPETGRASSAAAFVATCRKASRSLKGK